MGRPLRLPGYSVSAFSLVCGVSDPIVGATHAKNVPKGASSPLAGLLVLKQLQGHQDVDILSNHPHLGKLPRAHIVIQAVY